MLLLLVRNLCTWWQFMYHRWINASFWTSCFRARPFPRLPRAPHAALKPSLNEMITLTAYHCHRATTVLYRPRGHRQPRAILARTRCRLSRFLVDTAPGSGVHARRKTQLEIYRHFNISRTTMYTIYRRDYWRSIRKRPAPALTVDHLRLSPLISKISVLTVTFEGN